MSKTKSEKQEIVCMKNAIRLTEVAKRLGLDMKTLHRWRKNGLWTTKPGRFRFTTEEKLSEFMNQKDKKNAS